MNYEDVQKLANAAKAKIGLLNGNFLKYFLRAVMAGFFLLFHIHHTPFLVCVLIGQAIPFLYSDHTVRLFPIHFPRDH